MDFDSALEIFSGNIESVSRLVNFDKEVQEIAINGIEDLHNFLKKEKGFDNPKWNGERTLQMLRGIRHSQVLRERYSTIYNQAVVLMVSYFGSTISDVFRRAASRSLDRGDPTVLETELKIRIAEVLALRESASDQIGDLLIQKDGISFQDMQSTHRAFKQYFGVVIQTNETVRNIIVGQACRHAIVHDGATVNARTINQIRNASPRTLKPKLLLGEKIVFSISEIDELSSNMKQYISNLVTETKAA